MTEVTESGIREVILRMSDAMDNELLSKDESELGEYFTFKFDIKLSPETNLYLFSEALGIYKRLVRRWEEHHNGSFCVVERVRDKYLIPKIREFISNLNSYFIIKQIRG